MNVNEFILRRAMNKVADDGNWFKNKYEQATDWLAEKLLGEDERKRRDILKPDKPVTLGSKLPVYQDGKVIGARKAFGDPDIRSAEIYNSQKRIDDAKNAVEANNGLLHPLKEQELKDQLDQATNDAWELNDKLNNSDKVDISDMPYIDAIKKYPQILGNKTLNPNALIANTVAKYYPGLGIKNSDIEGLHKVVATYPEYYKASYANPELAEQAYKQSQEARKNANVTPNNHGYYPMGSWIPGSPSLAHLKNTGDSHNILFYNMNQFNDNANWWDKMKAASRMYQIGGSGDKQSRAVADWAGPHIGHQGGGAVPMDSDYKPTSELQNALGGSVNIRDIFAHELQHVPTITLPNLGVHQKINMASLFDRVGLWSNNNRDFYSMLPSEGDRTLHGIKAIASDLSGGLVTDFNKAIEVLQNQNLLTKTKEGFDFNYEQYENLLNEGKIKPTDPSMIIDLLNLDSYIRKRDFFSDYADVLYDNAVDPRTGEPVNKRKRSEMPDIWKEMIQHRFEMAQLNKNKGYRPGLGYSMNTMNGIPT